MRGGIRADAEILLLLIDCLTQLGIDDWQLVLGDAGLTQHLLAKFPSPLQSAVKDCITRLDYVELAALPYPDADSQQLALQLFDLRGDLDTVLQKLALLDLTADCQQSLDSLQALLNLVQGSTEKTLPIVLDLSWLQPFEYYTGMVFQVVSRRDNLCYVLGQGGRYDQLLSQYHPKVSLFRGRGFRSILTIYINAYSVVMAYLGLSPSLTILFVRWMPRPKLPPFVMLSSYASNIPLVVWKWNSSDDHQPR